MTHCIVNGQLIETTKARISLQDRGFRYGDGVFETLAVQNGVPYQFEWHMKRLEAGLNAIKIQYDSSHLADQCRQLLYQNDGHDGLLRIQITRGVGGVGYLPSSKSTPTVVIETSFMPPQERKTVALWQSSYSKISPRALPVNAKLCQGNSTLARMEAAENNCFDALLLNETGQVCETSSGNIFWRTDGITYTPSLKCGVLEGSTRAALLRLCPDIQEIEATVDELSKADAVCITNVVWKALAVETMMPGKTLWKSEELANYYSQLLTADRANYCRAKLGAW